MKILLTGTAVLAKTLQVKREKADDLEVLNSHLVVDEISIDRPTIDRLCGQRLGWSSEALFDELGAPRMRFEIRLKDLQLDAAGRIWREGRASDGNELELVGRATKIKLQLVPNGAQLAVRLTWTTAGDEAEDLAGMLGRDVEVQLELEGNPNADLALPGSPALTAAAEAAARGRGRPKGRKSRPVVDTSTGEVLP